MGYVHDTAMVIFTALEEMFFTVGTWTLTQASNIWTWNHTAAANVSIAHIPIRLPQNSAAYKGAFLKSIDIWWSNATANINDIVPTIYKVTLPTLLTGGSGPSVAAQTFTYDASHDTTAKRYTQDQHRMTITLSTPIWVDNNGEVFVQLSIDAASSSVVKLQAVRANYTLRL